MQSRGSELGSVGLAETQVLICLALFINSVNSKRSAANK